MTLKFSIISVAGQPQEANPGQATAPSANGTLVVLPARVAIRKRDAKRPHLRLVR